MVDNPFEIINQELMIQGYMPRRSSGSGGGNNIIGYGSLTPQGQAVMYGGGLNSNFDYNLDIFNPNAQVGDSSYTSIMSSGNNTSSTTSGFSYGNSSFKMDWSTCGFSLQNSHWSAVPNPNVSAQKSSASDNSKATPSGQDEKVSKNASYKFVKNGPNGTYTVEYTLNGKSATADDFNKAVGDTNFANIQNKLKEQNKSVS